MGLREWFIIGGILLIVIVLIDGIRRMRLAKRRTSELQFGLEEIRGGDDDEVSSVFPDGKARKVVNNDSELSLVKEGIKQINRQESELENSDTSTKCNNSMSQSQLSTSSDDNMSNIGVQQTFFDKVEQESRKDKILESEVAKNHVQVKTHDELDIDKKPIVNKEQIDLRVVGNKGDNIMEKPELSKKKLDIIANSSSWQNRVTANKNKSGKLMSMDKIDELIVVNVFLKDQSYFHGTKLLEAVLAEGMFFGDMSIFHRYVNIDGTGDIVFSMANGVKPGIFDMDKISQLKTQVVTFFLSLPGPKEPMMAFTLMVETARKIALDFGGELKDERQSAMISQTIEHYRQRIQDFERKYLTRITD